METLRKLTLFIVLLTAFGIGVLASKEPADYVADLKSLNTELNSQDITGQLRIQIQDDQVMLEVRADGLPPGITHQQYVYGFVSPTKAECPTPQHDENGDGVVDPDEIGAATGIRLIPLHDRPTSLELTEGKFPQADKEGKLHYRQTFSRKRLQKAMEEKFGMSENFANRTFILHGVSEEQQLPASTRSEEDKSLHPLIPIACGVLREGEWFD